MKTFNQIRELTGRKPTGDLVTNKRIGNFKVMIYKEPLGFVVYIDGDRLDVYKSKVEAEKAAKAMVNALTMHS